ncbi:MAG: DUF3817 domain-containing protein [Actinobacteria bacterium]|nr:DUF3817 domain-containing protein [Actinomycetota bacterium]MBV8961141.1 DUF3817 domain-containing protein [Actinomycetota bacterium]MBV9255538.1 DUF3817 domain-containing protein [Actinomycetota bacterium]MBV9665577.1 DUF3817 domain-containing protein [Actinomycetota bacterium]MBV9935201.1 DUF3817 domain-containing protein [Actinomycetota bacterium]
MPDYADDETTELERKTASLKWVSLIETVTYILLFAFWQGGSAAGTAVFGSIHGLVFLAFCGMVVGVRAEMGWTWGYVALAVLLGPLGAVLVYARLKREGVPAQA